MSTKAMTASDISLILERMQRHKTMRAIFEEGEWLTAGPIHAMQPSPQEDRSLLLDDWKAGGRIFSVRFDGIEYFAGYQFDALGQPLPVIRDILEALGPCADPWKIAAWLHFPNGWIGAAQCGSEAVIPVAPKDALDRRADMLAAARECAAPMSHKSRVCAVNVTLSFARYPAVRSLPSISRRRIAPREALQFDWNSEYAFIDDLGRPLEVDRVKLNASRAIWLIASPLHIENRPKFRAWAATRNGSISVIYSARSLIDIKPGCHSSALHAVGQCCRFRGCEKRREKLKPELDARLCETYPKIFASRHRSDTIIGARGFECGDGWYDLIDLLCHNLQGETDHNGGPQVEADQVKQKLAGLRFYAHGVNDRMRGMIIMAETVSYTVCEVCGERGKTLERAGIYQTRCVKHESV